MRLWELVALAAGGVLGSGWLTPPKGIEGSFPQSLLVWAVGCLLMAGYAVVVVELGIVDQRTGGLIFHPLRACGPLVATVGAGALWVAYAINPVTQSLSVATTLSKVHANGPSPLEKEPVMIGEAGPWLALAALLMAGVFLLTLLPFRRLLVLTVGLTATKVLALVAVVAAVVAHADARSFGELSSGSVSMDGVFNALKAVVQPLIGSSIIFSYIGFQAPVDFAGEVQGNERQAARTIRWAVYGTVAGSFVLYVALRFAWFLLPQDPTGTKTLFEGPWWQLAPVLVAAIVAPLGSAIVFSLALTREVAALSRAHLVHRVFQSARFSRIRQAGRFDVYWLITLVNLGVALVVAALAVGVGTWAGSPFTESLKGVNVVSILLVYTMSGVVLAVHPDRLGRLVKLFPGFIFVLTALIVVGTGIPVDKDKKTAWAASISAHVMGGVVLMLLAALILLGVPWLAQRDLPVVGRALRKLDARNHLARLGVWFGDASVPPFLWLMAYLVLLVVCVGLGGIDGMLMHSVALGLAFCGSLVTFVLLVRSSQSYMEAPDRNSDGTGAAD